MTNEAASFRFPETKTSFSERSTSAEAPTRKLALRSVQKTEKAFNCLSLLFIKLRYKIYRLQPNFPALSFNGSYILI
ncbi:MAG: hypothetical protein BWY75_02171 [bacterium ADurb.Bin425]|nr:MAG: hypothetical protein BWY75_02171 [bacterium ADurb.Bin425]